MAIAQRLEVRTSQSLVMTPQLQQAIKLLQLSQLDLAAFVETELDRNPLLARDEGEGGGEEAAAPQPAADDGVQALDREIAADDGWRDASGLEDGYDNVFGNDAAPDRGAAPEAGAEVLAAGSWATINGGRGDFDEELTGEARIAAPLSLHEHVAAQLADVALTGRDRIVAAALIDGLDEAGYLSEAPEAIAERLGIDPAAVLAVLAQLQTFDPPGVFARTLRECLEIQCREADRLDPAMAAVLARLDLVAARDVAQLAQLAGVDAEDVLDMIREIRNLNPKPGLAFDATPVQAVVADVFVRAGADGGWTIELNGDALPRLLIDRRYLTRLSGGVARADKSYVADCLASANWLLKALDQRAKTILKVATSLVRQQEGFLRHGISHLRPMNLRAIAEEIGMHESTVSRVTTNKWLSTPRGLFEMKFFFTSAIAAADGGEAHSAEAVRHRIRQLIEAEAPAAILSDDKLADLLKEEGIDIARRTVAKYREAMGLGSSTERRRQKGPVSKLGSRKVLDAFPA